jgi:hypothetical protein
LPALVAIMATRAQESRNAPGLAIGRVRAFEPQRAP